jgi:hypothetical protein
MSSDAVTETSGAGLRVHPGRPAPSPLSRLRALLARHGGYRLLALIVLPGVAFAVISMVMNQLGIVAWDTPAHLYKIAILQEQKAIFWDNNWYGGAYDIIGYGLVFYLVAQFVDYTVLVVISAGVLPVLFYLYMRRSYGDTSYWPAVALVLVLAVYLANGQDPFLFAMALMMAAMVLLAYRHPILAVLPAAAAIFANPVALVAGAVFLVAELIARPQVRGLYLRALLYLSPVLIGRVLVGLIFYERGSYVYNLSSVLLFLGYGVVGYLFVRLSRDPERLAKGVLFLTFMGFAGAIALVPGNPIGFNVGRFFFLFALPLLVSVRRLIMPAFVSGFLILAVAGGQMVPPAMQYFQVAEQPSTTAAFFTPALSFAAQHYDPNYRFHVVALQTHWEAYYFSINDFPITRGWYRQADALHNEVLSSNFDVATYTGWLRQMGVKYVFLPNAPLDWSGPRETHILQTSSDFTRVWADSEWTVYRLKDPSPMAVGLNGQPDPTVRTLLHQAIYLNIPGAGDYLIKATYSPYWQITEGKGSLSQSSDGSDFLVLHARHAGFYGIQVRVTLQQSLSELVRIF